MRQKGLSAMDIGNEFVSVSSVSNGHRQLGCGRNVDVRPMRGCREDEVSCAGFGGEQSGVWEGVKRRRITASAVMSSDCFTGFPGCKMVEME